MAKRPYHSLKTSNKNYKLRFTTNSVIEMEEALGMGVPEIGDLFSSSFGHLGADRIAEIRNTYAQGTWSQEQLAGMFGVDRLTIRAVITGETPKWTIKQVRTMLWAGLLDQHEDVTTKEAGEVIDSAGFGPAMEAVMRAFQDAFPSNAGGDDEAGSESNGSGDPKGAVSTGTNS